MTSTETVATCPVCGTSNSAFNPRCASCGELLGTGERSPSGEAAPLAQTVANSAASASSRAGAAFPGARLGRFEVTGKLGEGAVGEVVRALDPTLGREVAIKVLRSRQAGRSGDGAARARLVREAQAMARLKHPNVVTVHEVDASGEEVLVVMECVEGRTLRAFCEERRGRKAEILHAFVEAGRGLHAVHRAGLVHRDFKPDNVLVGVDGRARVTDFGLVGLAEGEAGSGAVGEEGKRPDVSLTRSGTMLGTPAYMAPEQHARRPLDARADQFAFCVALWEALVGERPFAGATYEELCTGVMAGRVREPPPRADLPAWIRRILLRGLSVSRDDRYPDMEALLFELGNHPAMVRRRALGAASALVLAGCSALALFWRSPAALCRGGEARLAGIWDGAVKGRVRQAFAATGKLYAEDTFGRVERALDERALAWTAMYRDSCEATHIRGEQSPALLDLRTACLEQRRLGMGALTGLLSRGPDPEVLERAVPAALALSDVEGCADASQLTAAVPPPADAATRARVDGLRARLAEAKALDDAGKYKDALALAKPLADEARGTSYAPVEAQALLLLGRVQSNVHDLPAAEATFRQAAQAAPKARDDLGAVEAWIGLVNVIGYLGGRHADALALRLATEGAVERAGGGAFPRARLLGVLAKILDEQGKFAEALDHVDRAIAALEGVRVPDPTYPVHLVSVRAGVLVHLERFDEAERAYASAIERREQLLGPDHPAVALTLASAGRVFVDQGKEQEAMPYFDRALAIQERSLGAEHPFVAVTLNNLGNALNTSGHSVRALEVHRRALAIREKAYGPDHPDTAMSLNNVGIVLETLDRFVEAVPYYERALAAREKALGSEHAAVAATLVNLGRVLSAQKHYPDAIARFERALAIREKALGPTSLAVASTASTMASTYIDMSSPAEALPFAERALAIYAAKGTGVHPLMLADAHFNTAEALWGAGRDRRRAVDLAKQARDTFAGSKAEYAKKALALVETWLAAHPAR